MSIFPRHRQLISERLESRRLLAADLHISMEVPAGPFSKGDKVSYSFTTTNRGEDLQQLHILDTPTVQLDEVSWTSSEMAFPTNASQLAAQGGFLKNPTALGTNMERFNASVAGGGDYDGDGFADAISGSRGSVQVFLGGPQAATVSIVIPESIKPQLADVSDFDNDGFDDFAIALGSNPSRLPAEMIIVYGQADLRSVAGRQITIDSDELSTTRITGFPEHARGASANDAYALVVANPGDLNADGHDEIVVAVVPPGDKLKARAFVLFGGQARRAESLRVDDLDVSSGFVTEPFTVEPAGDRGVIKAGVAGGDLNADGTDDLVIAGGGAIHVIYGGKSIGAGGVLKLNSQDEESGFSMFGLDAFHVDVADDINGDGIPDLLAGSTVLFGGGDWLGSSRFEASMLESNMGFRIVAEDDAMLDKGIGYIGDINSDGLGDFAVGVIRPPEYHDRFHTNRSTAHIVFGGPDVGKGGVLALNELSGDAGFRYRDINDVYSFAFASVGDRDGDGIDDFAMDTTTGHAGQFEWFADGEAYFFRGQTPIKKNGIGDLGEVLDLPAGGAVGFTITGRLRSSVDELVVEPTVNPPTDLSVTLLSELPESLVTGQSVTYEFELFNHADDAAKAARVTDAFATQLENVTWTRVDGTPPVRILNNVEGVQAIDPETADALYSNRKPFDFNGDGIEDDLSHIVENAVIPKDLFDDRWERIARFANLGDINADGLSDLWIGFDLVGFDRNGIVVFGSVEFGPEPLEVFKDGRNFFKIGEHLFVQSADGIGDVNADGIDDFAIGATRHKFRGRGAAFVVFGKRDWTTAEIDVFGLDGRNGFILTGERRYLYTHAGIFNEGDDVGERLGAAGDFNGDGIDDFVVGSSPCPVSNQFCDPIIPADYPRADHVVFGRDLRSDGTGPADEVVTVPPQTGIRYIVTGTVPSRPGILSGQLLSNTSAAQLDRNSANNSANLEIEVRVWIAGDINRDRIVDFSDFLILMGNFGRQDAASEDGDIDGDKLVGFGDFLILSQNFQG